MDGTIVSIAFAERVASLFFNFAILRCIVLFYFVSVVCTNQGSVRVGSRVSDAEHLDPFKMFCVSALDIACIGYG